MHKYEAKKTLNMWQGKSHPQGNHLDIRVPAWLRALPEVWVCRLPCSGIKIF